MVNNRPNNERYSAVFPSAKKKKKMAQSTLKFLHKNSDTMVEHQEERNISYLLVPPMILVLHKDNEHNVTSKQQSQS